MAYTVVFHPKAEKELLKSIEWYEEISEGLGEEFLNDIVDVIETLEIFPFMYAVRKKNFREGILKNFPFVVVYSANKTRKEIHVLSIFQTNQKPEKKYKK